MHEHHAFVIARDFAISHPMVAELLIQAEEEFATDVEEAGGLPEDTCKVAAFEPGTTLHLVITESGATIEARIVLDGHWHYGEE